LLVTISSLNPATAKIENENAEIHNFYNISVLNRFLPELQARRNASLESGKEIVNRFNEFYPGVLLCGKAPQQLSNWSASLTVLDQVKQALTTLSEFSQKWENGEIDEFRAQTLRDLGLAFQVSGESQTVRNAPKLRREREFWLPTGRQEFFEQHIKLSFSYRLHFFPDNATRQIYLGYIGPHLRLR